MAHMAHFFPKALWTQWYTPPFSGKAAESSAETRDVGMRKTTAEKMKKKMSELPKRAAAGKFLILSIAAIMRMTSENKEIFFT